MTAVFLVIHRTTLLVKSYYHFPNSALTLKNLCFDLETALFFSNAKLAPDSSIEELKTDQIGSLSALGLQRKCVFWVTVKTKAEHTKKRCLCFYTLLKESRSLLKKRPNKCTSSVSFLSHLFTLTCLGRHSTIIRVLDVKEYSKLQRVHPSRIQFLKCVMQF